MKFPKTIYVVWDEPSDGDFLLLAGEKLTDHAEIGYKKPVGVYQLVEEAKIATQVTLVSTAKPLKPAKA